MATFLFDEIIFGPVRSRRLGTSLGVNLLPLDKKYCNFDCLYCECGWSCNSGVRKSDLPTRAQVSIALEQKIIAMVEAENPPDVITFAGNGEPTMHPEFEGIIDDTVGIRNKLAEKARIAVLSNSLTIHKSRIVQALKKTDQPILKLDTAIEETYQFINRPAGSRKIQEIISDLAAFGEGLILQTLFFKGSYKGTSTNNTSPEELNALFEAYKTISPDKIMIYTFERDTPVSTLEKIPLPDLEAIGKSIQELGFEVEISA